MESNPQMEVSFRDIAATSYLLRDRVLQTQCVRSQLTSYLKCKSLFLKLEYKQNGGSFKTRGAFNALMTIPREDRKKGIVVASQGNHGIALSYAGRKLGAPVTVVVPRFAPASKVQVCRKYGANVIIDGDDLHDSHNIAREIAKRENLKFIDIFANLALGVGNATVGIETAQQVPRMDYCIVPYTMEKGILKGLQVAIRKMCPCCKIYAVRCASENPSRLGLNGDPIVDRIIDISDDDILTAFLLLVEVEKVLVERSSAMALAALTSRKYPEFVDKNVVCFLGNGNVDLAAVTKLLAKSNSIPMNSITFSVSIPDEIGSLQYLCAEISKHSVSIRDIVFPKNTNGEKMIVFCETTGPEHTKTFIRNMMAVYSDFQVIPLRTALKDNRFEPRPFFMSNQHKDDNDHDENNMSNHRSHRSMNMSKESTGSRYNSRKSGGGGASGERVTSFDSSKHSQCKRHISPVPRSGRFSSSGHGPSSHIHPQLGTAKRSKTHNSISFSQVMTPMPDVYNEEQKADCSEEFYSRERYDKRSKNRSHDQSYAYGNDSRDAMFVDLSNEGGAIVAGGYEQTDHHKIYTVDRYDNQLSPLGGLRVEEKRSVSKTVGRIEIGDKRHIGKTDKILHSTIISHHQTEPRYSKKPLRARQEVSGEKSGEDDNRSETDPTSRISSCEKSGDSMENRGESRSKSLIDDYHYSNKPDSSEAFDVQRYVSTDQTAVGPWISLDTVDDHECHRSTISVSEQNLYNGEQSKELGSREPSKFKKCKIDHCPFSNRQKSRRSPTPDREDLYCECGKKILENSRHSCQSYKSKDSQNAPKDSQKASKSSQHDHIKSKSGELSEGSSASSSATSVDNFVTNNQSSFSNRLDAGADEYHFLFHDCDYESCHCSKTMVSAKPFQSDVRNHVKNLLDLNQANSSIRKKTSFSEFEASLLKPMDFI